MKSGYALQDSRPKPVRTFSCMFLVMAAAASFWAGLYWVVARWFG